ncbi:MAG TPA: nucleotide disphospho-sugar-binding domain-containing protein [Methylomirabilota bacterium]|nr:nucleotide disphospho-sugar-binding domain-containing protein [Methylomirabilota bacterium]
MARILLGWELGNGIGYARRLAAIADRLMEAGHEPVLALREPKALPDPTHPVLQAPLVVGRLRPGTRGFVPAGFTDLIAVNGFGSHDHLLELVAGWQAVLDEARPDLVIAEYAPVLVMAAWRRIATVLIGTPYLVPPAEGPWFPERPGIRPYANQRALLEVMRRAQAARGGPLPDRLTQPFSEAVRVVYGVPELDPWTRERRERLNGLWEPVAPAGPPASTRLFAYLTPKAPAFPAAAEGLARAGVPGEAFIPGCPDRLAAVLGAGGVELLREPPALAEAVGRASLVFHHGGMDTAQTALALGRPQLILPRYLDQRLTGDALAALGVGILHMRASATAETVAQALRRLAGDATMAARASLRATLIRRRGIGDALGSSVAAARHALSDVRPLTANVPISGG